MSKGYLFANDDGTYNGVVSVLKTIAGIDGKAVAVTTGYAVPSGKTVVLTGVNVRITAEDTILAAGSVSIQTSGLQTAIGTTALTGLNSTSKVFTLNTMGFTTVAVASGSIDVSVDVGFTATSVTLAVDLLGYLI